MLTDHVLTLEQAKELKDDILAELDNPKNCLFDVPIEFYWISFKGKEKFKLVDNDQMKYYEDHCNYFDDEYDYYPALMANEFINILLPSRIIDKGTNVEYEFIINRFFDIDDEIYYWNAKYYNKEVENVLLLGNGDSILLALFDLYSDYKKYAINK